MRIGIDARFVGPQGTGLGKYTEELVTSLQKIDKKNHYFIFLQKNNWNFLKLSPKNFNKILADVPWYSIEEQIRLPAFFRREKLDVLHVPHFNVPIFYTGKLIVTIHDLIHHQFEQESATTGNPFIFKLKRLGYKLVIASAVRKASKIITPSRYVKEQIIKAFNIPKEKEKVVVTYEAAEEEYFGRQPSAVSRQPFLIYVGNLYPHKNLPKLLDALTILKNINLVIVCPRDIFLKRLESEIRSRNIETRVKTVAYLDAKKLSALFAKASTYVFPSLSEGFGIPGLNAMAAGLPVAASDIPVLREIYGDAALYFNPSDPADIAKKVKEVLTNPQIRSDLIGEGREQVKKYSWQKMAQETLNVYESINK